MLNANQREQEKNNSKGENQNKEEKDKDKEKDKDLVCTKCGHLCIKHDSIFIENTEPLFCPDCKSHNLKYTMDFTT